MNKARIAKRPLMLVALVATLGALAGCKPSQAPAPDQSEAATPTANPSGPDAKPGISAADGRLILPVVAGRPGVAYFTVKNGTGGNVALASVHIDGVGKAEMHQTAGGTMVAVDHAEIGPGAQIAFEPGGLHVMAFDIDPKLKPGGETEMTLTFSDRDKLSMPVHIEAMGAGSGGMDMKH